MLYLLLYIIILLYHINIIIYNQVLKFYLDTFSTRNVILYNFNIVFIHIYTDDIHSISYHLLTNIKNVSSLYYTLQTSLLLYNIYSSLAIA